MQLTLKDKIYLMSCGYKVTDFKQISSSAKKCKIMQFDLDDNTRRIKQGDFIKLFGREGFLNRLARATFHFSSFYFDEVNKNGYLFEIQGV